MKMVKVAVVGAAGYTGAELLRFLIGHPHAEIVTVTSGSESGRPVADLFSNFRGYTDLVFSDPETVDLRNCDLVFFATPNGVAMRSAPPLLEHGIRIIDLSADYRLKDVAVWEQWYQMQHASPQWLPQAVYGLPEMNRETLKSCRLAAMPGCYPTSVQLGFIPLLEKGIVNPRTLIADCKSGVSGAGRTPKLGSLYCEAGESLAAYAVGGHRHLPEILQGLTAVGGADTNLTFVPHLTPMIRGIHATLYADLTDMDADLQDLFKDYYDREPFVDVMPEGSHPDTRAVRGSNVCRIACHKLRSSNKAVILVVEDNLVKGAAGQAVQVMNIMNGLEETAGLVGVSPLP